MLTALSVKLKKKKKVAKTVWVGKKKMNIRMSEVKHRNSVLDREGKSDNLNDKSQHSGWWFVISQKIKFFLPTTVLWFKNSLAVKLTGNMTGQPFWICV